MGVRRDFIRPNSPPCVWSGMTDLEDAVSEFLSETDVVLKEYDRGYMDADAALNRVENHIEELREQTD